MITRRRRDSKRVYSLLAITPSVAAYLVAIVYKHNETNQLAPALAEAAALVLSVMAMTRAFVKIKIAFWLRRRRFAVARLVTFILSAIAGIVALIGLFAFRLIP